MSDQQMNEASLPQPQEEGQPAAAPAMPLPGAALAAQRQKKGWSVEQVASLVKLSPRQIQAIETDNYSALPGLAVARGFVRSYAKAVGLDANQLTSGMPQESAVAQRDHIVPHHSLSTPFSEGPLPAMMMSTRGSSSPLLVIVAVVAVAVAVAAAAVRWTDLGGDLPQLGWLKAHKEEVVVAPDAASEATPSAESGASDTPVNARVDTIAPNADDAAKAAGSTASEPSPAAAQVAPVQSATPAAPTVAPGAAKSAASAATSATGATASASQPAAGVPTGLRIVNSQDMLHLSFREDSWVEIRRADKTTIISRLLKAGTSEAFDVSDATTLVIGNAAGVDATLRGRPLDLKTPGGSNVARLDLH